MNKIRRLFLPGAIFVLAVFFMFAGANEPVITLIKGTIVENWLHNMHIGNSIVFGIATGVFSGMVVWFFVVFIPEQKKRKILKDNLSSHYRFFRERLLRIFLFAVNDSADNILVEKLQDYREFRKFFDEESDKYDGKRWYDVVNYLVDNQYYLQEIIRAMEELSREAAHVREQCGIRDKEVYIFLGMLSGMAHDYKNMDPHSDNDLKPFMRFLWSIFAQWNPSDGRHEEDFIQIMIDKI